jgi:hypothetical protein
MRFINILILHDHFFPPFVALMYRTITKLFNIKYLKKKKKLIIKLKYKTQVK